MKKNVVILLTLVLLFASACSHKTDAVAGEDIFPSQSKAIQLSQNSIIVRTNVKTASPQPLTKQSDAVSALKALGIQLDADKSYSPVESIAIAVKLLGKEQEALKADYPHPFEGISAELSPYVGYAYAMRLVEGGNLDSMGAGAAANILRGSADAASKSGAAKGDELAALIWQALTQPLPSGETPAQRLIESGAISEDAFAAAQAALGGGNTAVLSANSTEETKEKDSDDDRERSRKDDDEGIPVIYGPEYGAEIIESPASSSGTGHAHSSGSSSHGSSSSGGSSNSGSTDSTNTGGSGGSGGSGTSGSGSTELPTTGGAGGENETPTIPFA